MKRIMILGAAGIILAANTSVLISVTRNRSDARGGTVELTERELRLPQKKGESTAIFLELEWDTLSAPGKHRRAPQWLDIAKLTELGFACHVPVTHPNAHAYYGSLMPKKVFVVLEYEGEAWKKANTDRRQKTRLFAIDVGRDPCQLRQRYTDVNQFIITQCLVRVIVQDRSIPDYEPLPQPCLEGRIVTMLPHQIFVPHPYSKTLINLYHSNMSTHDTTEEEPRFAVTVSWGRYYEPWVTDIRRLTVDNPVTETH